MALYLKNINGSWKYIILSLMPGLFEHFDFLLIFGNSILLGQSTVDNC